MSILDHTTPDPSTISNRSIALRFGAIWGGFTILSSLVGFLTDTDPSMPDAGPLKWVYTVAGLAVAVWAIAAAIKADREQLGGYIGLGRCVGLGTMMGLVSSIIGAVYFLLYSQVLNPGYKEDMDAAIRQQWEAQGMTEEQMDAAAGMASAFTNPIVLVIFQIIGGVIFGVILGLIVGAILKRDRPHNA